MTLTELIKKKINKDLGYWKIEDYAWLLIDDGKIKFRYGGCSLLATDNFEAYNYNTDEDDRYMLFYVDEDTLDCATKYLFNLKLEDELKNKINDKIKKVKI